MIKPRILQTRSMMVKVCGITNLDQLGELDKMLVDFVGFNFCNGNPTNIIGKIPALDLKYANVDVKKVGIFSNQSLDFIHETILDFGLDLVQLNGNEHPDLCRSLSDEITVIKTIYLDKDQELKLYDYINLYDDVCDYYSFDAMIPGNRGGVTTAFNWDTLETANIEKPFFIGGDGIKPIDAPRIHAFKHPDFIGVDLNHHFDKEPGLKDTSMILSFMRAVNQVVN
jgi:phosphoribosylanthranilate isomerase